MVGIDRCFRCGAKLEGGFTSITLAYHSADPTNPPLQTFPNKFCRDCMRSFYAWSKEGKEANE